MDIFTQIAIVMSLAAVLVWVARRFKQSAIVAYLLLGFLVGPSGFSILPADVSATNLSEIGLVFLLFFIGLEFELATLKMSAKLAVGGTLVQVGLTAGAVMAIVLLRGGTAIEGILIGIGLGLSSTAIVIKAFEERQEADSQTAKTALTVLLGQDLVAMLVSAVVPLLYPGRSAEWGVLVGLFVGVPLLFIFAQRFLPWLLKRAAVSQDPESFGLASLAACLAVAVGAHAMGANMGLGAFLGGLVFAGSPYKHQMRADLATLKHLALGFFFLCIGMLIDGRYIVTHLPIIVLGLVVLVTLKMVVAGLVFRMFGSPWTIAAGAGLSIAQAGEFTFVLAMSANEGGLLSKDLYQLTIALAILSMVPSPALVARARQFGHWCAEPALRRRRAALADGPSKDSAPKKALKTGASPTLVEPDDDDTMIVAPNRAIVVGYGPVGKTLCRILERFGVRPCVVDLKPETIKRLVDIDRDAIFGDASRREVLHAAGIDRARYLIITLPDYQSRLPIIASAREINPKVTILSRARYLSEQRALDLAGVSLAAYEECEVAAELARLLLTQLKADPKLVEEEVKRLRSEIAMRTGFTRAMPRLDQVTTAQMLSEISQSLRSHDE